MVLRVTWKNGQMKKNSEIVEIESQWLIKQYDKVQETQVNITGNLETELDSVSCGVR
jgi:hypothetical protein